MSPVYRMIHGLDEDKPRQTRAQPAPAGSLQKRQPSQHGADGKQPLHDQKRLSYGSDGRSISPIDLYDHASESRIAAACTPAPANIDRSPTDTNTPRRLSSHRFSYPACVPLSPSSYTAAIPAPPTFSRPSSQSFDSEFSGYSYIAPVYNKPISPSYSTGDIIDDKSSYPRATSSPTSRSHIPPLFARVNSELIVADTNDPLKPVKVLPPYTGFDRHSIDACRFLFCVYFALFYIFNIILKSTKYLQKIRIYLLRKLFFCKQECKEVHSVSVFSLCENALFMYTS